MDETQEKLRLLRIGKILAKVLFWLGIPFELVGMLKMMTIDYTAAAPFYITGAVFFLVGLAFYLAIRVGIILVWSKHHEEFSKDTRNRKTRGVIVHLSIDALLVTAASLLLANGATLIDNAAKIPGVGNTLMGALASFVKPGDGGAKEALKKTDGFMKDVCHVYSDEECATALAGNMEWDRYDMEMVEAYDKTTRVVTPGAGYLSRKASYQHLVDKGMKIFAVTPYPKSYAAIGIDPRKDEQALSDIAKFFVDDLTGVVGAFQISNELMEPRFSFDNMNDEENAHFLGIQIAAMQEEKKALSAQGKTAAGDILVGYNVADFIASDFILTMKPYNPFCDYVGLDLYLGCFEGTTRDLSENEMMLRMIYGLTGKPVIECEFGYIGLGQDKSTAEREAWIQKKYPGFTDEADCRSRAVELIKSTAFTTETSLQPRVISYAQQHYNDMNISLENISNEQAAYALFDTELANHFYCILDSSYYLTDYPHTREGAASFFKDQIPFIARLPFVIGAMVYHISESEECYFCGQSECPNECGWGMWDPRSKELFPAFYAVRDAFAAIAK